MNGLRLGAIVPAALRWIASCMLGAGCWVLGACCPLVSWGDPVII